MFTVAFWKATAERAVSTAAQAVLTLAGPVSWWTDVDVTEAKTIGIAAVSAAALAVVKALAAGVLSKGDGPSFTPDAEVSANLHGTDVVVLPE
jgi:hypothetical protein